MASPDFSQYIDLTINDKQPDEIYNEAVDYARLALPEFFPRSGTIEGALLQAASLVSAINLGEINRLPDGLMEGILRYMGITRKEATFGTVNIVFQVGAAGGTVPDGTIAVYETTDGDLTVRYPFITSGDNSAAAGSTSVTIQATSQVSGIIPDISVNTILSLAQPSATVISATTSSLITQGARAETQTEYFSRGTTSLETLNSTLATASQLEKYILFTYAEVYRCKVYDLTKVVYHNAGVSSLNGRKTSGTTAGVSTSNSFITNANIVNNTEFLVLTPEFYGDNSYVNIMPTGVYVGASAGSASVTYTDVVSASGYHGPINVVALQSAETGQVGDWPGHFAIYVCDSNGDPITQAKKSEIITDIENRTVAGLTFELLDAYPVDIDFVVTISVDQEYGASSVATETSTELEEFISMPNWPDWNQTVRIFDVVVRASRVTGVSYVYSVTSSVPNYAAGASPGNELLLTQINDGGVVVGYNIDYIGVLPRASVEVVVI